MNQEDTPVKLLPSPEEIAQKLADEMDRGTKDLITKMQGVMDPKNQKISLVSQGNDVYQFPDPTFATDFNALSKKAKAKIQDFVKLSGWDRVYTKTIDVAGREFQEVLVIARGETLFTRLAAILE